MSNNANNKCNFICKHCGERCDRCIGVCEHCGCICEENNVCNACNEHKESREGNNSNNRKRKKTYMAYDFPTENQVRALRFITMYTGIVFEGNTKNAARAFIKTHLDEARENSEKYEWE